jgi:hypothetical protein
MRKLDINFVTTTIYSCINQQLYARPNTMDGINTINYNIYAQWCYWYSPKWTCNLFDYLIWWHIVLCIYNFFCRFGCWICTVTSNTNHIYYNPVTWCRINIGKSFVRMFDNIKSLVPISRKTFTVGTTGSLQRWRWKRLQRARAWSRRWTEFGSLLLMRKPNTLCCFHVKNKLTSNKETRKCCLYFRE